MTQKTKRTKWVIEVYVGDKRGWVALSPTHSNEHYFFGTKQEAIEMANILYPDHLDKVRVTEVKND